MVLAGFGRPVDVLCSNEPDGVLCHGEREMQDGKVAKKGRLTFLTNPFSLVTILCGFGLG